MSSTSPYTTTPMAETVELQMREGCKSYELYVTSEFRRSMFMTSNTSKDDTTLRLSILNAMYTTDKASYDNLINKFEKHSKKNKQLFLGVSNDAAVFLAAGKVILDTVNTYLDNYERGASVRRVVLTNEIGEKEPPKCYPYRPGQDKYRHKPNTNPPPNSFAWESHLAEYYVDNPKMWHIPSEVVANVETVIDGKKVVANIEV